MRVTNTSIARNYSSGLNKSLEVFTNAQKRVSSRKFFSMAEDTASGVRAMSVRRSMSQITGYLDNANNAKSVFAGAEKNLLQISDLAKSISDKFIVGMNGEKSESDRDIIATELEKLRDEMLNCANGQFSDRLLFGGTNTKTPPFTTVMGSDNMPVLYYNGVEVSTISKGNGVHDYLFSDAAYIDVGIGMAMQKGNDSQNVVSNTAFKNTLVGLDFLGSGSENIYNVVNEMIVALRNPSFDAGECGQLLERFKASTDNVGQQLTKLGSDSQYLDFTVSRLETENDNLIAQKERLEIADPYEAIMDLKMQEYVYNAALQMGSRLLQPSIFQFIR